MTDTARLTEALEGRYSIERELGAGGMATVYLAHDVRHDRKVALKVLRPELSAILGAGRFLSEIKTTANLQHPHILPLHDSGEADGLVYYVMPYVEGESLRDKLAREHQLPVEEAVRVAAEIADALQYAHEQGVIHRDIKPENVLLHGGHALVADFGIALAAARTDGSTRMTETGMSLGTPAYMAPEQAMGEREITPRADIYALGAVLYEMLSGEPPFVGPTAQAIVARMMTEEPRPLALQRHTIPEHVELAVRKALEKLPADRFATAAEFKLALADTGARTHGRTDARTKYAALPPYRRTALIPWAIAAVAVLGAAVVLLRPRAEPPVIRYGLALPASQAALSYPAIPSPDGASLLFVGPAPGQAATNFQLWLKSRDRYDAVPVPGTVGVWIATFSPDGKWIAYIQDAHLMKTAVTGGSPVTVGDSAAPGQGGIAWLDDGTIVYVHRGGRGLRRVAAAGGAPRLVYAAQFTTFEPTPLPGSRGVLFGQCSDTNCNSTKVMVLKFGSSAAQPVVTGAGFGQYLPTGHLLYVRDDGAAFVQAFDLGSLTARGSPVSVLDSISTSAAGFPLLGVSAAGTLVARLGVTRGIIAGRFDMVWVDRSGRTTPIDMGGPLTIDPGGGNPGWVLSPDGKRLAIGLMTPSGGDIWVKQLPTGPLSRVTFDSTPDIRPRWMPGARTISYVASRAGKLELHRVNADGTGGDTVLARHPEGLFEGALSPDGQWIVARIRGGIGAQKRDIIGFRRGDSTAVPLIASPFDEDAFRISPDGHWIAYESDETGRREVYVRPFPNTNAGKWQASTEGGYAPLWAPNGRELFFVDVQRRMTVVPFTPGPEPRLGERRVLFAFPASLYLWENDYYTPFDISPDGQRFIMARRIESNDAREEPLVVVENWFTELRARLKGR